MFCGNILGLTDIWWTTGRGLIASRLPSLEGSWGFQLWSWEPESCPQLWSSPAIQTACGQIPLLPKTGKPPVVKVLQGGEPAGSGVRKPWASKPCCPGAQTSYWMKLIWFFSVFLLILCGRQRWNWQHYLNFIQQVPGFQRSTFCFWNTMCWCFWN